MAPSPQEHETLDPKPSTYGTNKVVISGMSGLYPQSKNVKEFSEILYNKVNPVSSKVRWKYNHPEVSSYLGSVPGLNLFDAQFFKVHYRLGNMMDTMSRKILEQCYQAIYDAGLSPELFAQKKVGVFVGTCFSESEKASVYLESTKSGLGILGCNRAMYANRVSYWLNLKGPSMAIDEGCCSSIAALEQAHLSISRGDCDAAIVGSASICLNPQTTVHSGRVVQMCEDGKTKSFDENADGCVRSEAIVVFILQKAEDALRIYADVVHVKSRLESSSIRECVTGQEYGFTRNPLAYEKFLRTFYAEAKVSPASVEYVEAFGSAVPEADKSELEAIGQVFCNGRKKPLLVGSVISNIGYTEASSGNVALTKVLLGYHRGEIAANLHLTNPRRDIQAIKDGRMQLVADHQPIGRTYTAINNLSVTGCSAHMLLHGQYKPKNLSRYKCNIPRLVTLSARHEHAAQRILDDLKSRPIDPEELALLHNAHSTNIVGHLGKAFIILDTDAEGNTVSLSEACEYCDNARRPLWFVYSGMGSQWAGMGTQLLRIPVFAAAIERCQKALQPKGIDLYHIITSSDPTIFDNILNSFVGIAAIQIGLTDVLRALGLVPDKIIGHSVGELGCAYADGCFTAEEMILSAYSRGLVSVETPFIHGSMAAVGIGYQQIKDMVPYDIQVACHNSADSSTISGPADIMKEFVESLTAKGIFAKEVPCSNIAYHSRYIADAGPGLLKYLSEVIKDPKPRSDRWVSTSVPKDQWDQPAAKYSSAEYHTNNLLNPVLFEETSKLIPPTAVLVEIAPHGLLQAILKRSMPLSCKNIPLTRRGHPDNALMVLEAVGNLFMEGYNPQVAVLYPKVEFPVSTSTPMLSHLVDWAHQETWKLPLYVHGSYKTTANWNPIVTVHDEENSFLRGHVIREQNVYPFAAALVAAWDTLAMSLGKPKRQFSVRFNDVQLFVQPVLHEHKELRLGVALHRGTGRFEILHGHSKVATGYVDAKKEFEMIKITGSDIRLSQSNKDMDLTSEDIYQMFYEREYSYSGDFRSIQCADTSLTEAYVAWTKNWVTLLDGLLQLNALKQNHDAVSQPHRISSVRIDMKNHFLEENLDHTYNGKKVLKVNLDELHNNTKCGGVTINDVTFKNLGAVQSPKVVLSKLGFVPHFNSHLDIKSALQVFLQIVAQNKNKKVINVVEIENDNNEESVFDVIKELDKSIPDLEVQFDKVKKDEVVKKRVRFASNADLVLVHDLGMDDSIFKVLHYILPRDTFVVIAEDSSLITQRSSALREVSTQNTGDLTLHLTTWKPSASSLSSTAFTVRSRDVFSMLSTTRDSLPLNQKLLLLTPYPPVEGLKDLVAKWRKEPERNQVQLFMLSYNEESDPDLKLSPEMNLAYNVYKNNVWGGEYYLPLLDKETEVTNMTLQCERIGDLSSLHWVEVPPSADDQVNGIKVDVHYASLNTLDANRAAGVYPFKQHNHRNINSYGMDFSGVTSRGDKVMGILPNGSCSKTVKANLKLLWPVPNHWTLEEAATVPLPYAHAFYCILIKMNMTGFNRSVLVHGGTGALGQAAISICLAQGMKVFATVSDVRKKRFLMKLFPELREDYIGCSRDHTFVDMVLTHTKKEGVDCVFNCVPGDLKNESMRCLSEGGVMFDTVQIPGNEDFTFGMFHLSSSRNYVAVDFSSIFSLENQEIIMKKIQLLISEGISRGYVRPLSCVTYGPQEAARALRLLGASRHRGRVLLRLTHAQPPASPSITYSEQQLQLVVSNNSTLGLQLVDRLVARGARRIHLQVPNMPAQTLYKQMSWQKVGAKVITSSENFTSSINVQALLNKVTAESLEGIFVIDSKTSDSKFGVGVLKLLDKFSRQHTKCLKYFGVISDDSSFGNDTCVSRARDGLPATKLSLPAIKQMTTSTVDSSCTDGLSWKQVINGLERALHSKQPVVYASPQDETRITLVEKIATVAGIADLDDVDDTTTLQDLGVTQEKAQSIKVLLRDDHNLWLSEDAILLLSIKDLQDLDQMDEGKLEETKGIEGFFSYIDPDELMATVDMVFLPTLTSKDTEEFDVTLKYICIVPGLEGNYERFRALSERLKLPALVLQAGLDRPHDTVRETAEQLATTLIKKARIQNDFYLVGYESGVMVALEVAAILEERGFTGTVYCVGTSPEEFQETLEEELKIYSSEADLQEAVIRHLFSLMTGRACDLEFREDSTWQEKLEYCMRSLRVPLSSQYVRAYFEAAYGKIVQVRQYKPRPLKLRSKIVLLRTATTTRPITTSEPLQRYSQQPISVHQLHMPLAHALKDLRCANIINCHLHPDILAEFETKDLCEIYTTKNALYSSPEELGITIE